MQRSWKRTELGAKQFILSDARDIFEFQVAALLVNGCTRIVYHMFECERHEMIIVISIGMERLRLQRNFNLQALRTAWISCSTPPRPLPEENRR